MALRLAKAGLQSRGALQRRRCSVKFPQHRQHQPEILPGQCPIGPEPDRRAQTCRGGTLLATCAQCRAQAVMRRRETWIQTERGLIPRLGGLDLASQPVPGRQRVM